MAAIPESAAFERAIDPVLQLLLPGRAAEVVSFRRDEQLAARIDELAEKCTEGELTPDERAEYAGYVRANSFVAILQRRAQQLLRQSP